MPIQVYIEVNGRPVETVHIGREEGDTNADSINTYRVLKTGPSPKHDGSYHGPSYREWTEEGKAFTHRYGDGIEKCVEKALECLNGED